jgi:predicted enzyme related to lactoylglutathione lyase
MMPFTSAIWICAARPISMRWPRPRLPVEASYQRTPGCHIPPPGPRESSAGRAPMRCDVLGWMRTGSVTRRHWLRVRGTGAWWAVTIDCHEPRRLGRFWAELLATPIMDVGPVRPGWVRLQPLAPHGPFVNFQPVPERKVGKLRLHLDVLVGDLESGTERVVALGGTDTGRRETLPRGPIAVVLDPEGNEFCVLAPPTR